MSKKEENAKIKKKVPPSIKINLGKNFYRQTKPFDFSFFFESNNSLDFQI